MLENDNNELYMQNINEEIDDDNDFWLITEVNIETKPLINHLFEMI